MPRSIAAYVPGNDSFVCSARAEPAAARPHPIAVHTRSKADSAAAWPDAVATRRKLAQAGPATTTAPRPACKLYESPESTKCCVGRCLKLYILSIFFWSLGLFGPLACIACGICSCIASDRKRCRAKAAAARIANAGAGVQVQLSLLPAEARSKGPCTAA